MENSRDTQARWLTVLSKLRVDRSRGIAPHKPLLLLVVLKLVENGDEDTRDQKSLRDFRGLRIALPSNAKLWPDPQNLAWHRENKLCA